ncbi:MAG: B12-binding domain-containing radical SAM protein [Elusimicrobia bacterium]|nr:B12-binding domain-containing radical SAM protein [Elusimicrobiota bacterium]
MPFGLAYISAYARKEGHEIDVIDLRKLSGWDEFHAEVKKRSPGIFGISSMSMDFAAAAEAARLIKEADAFSVVVLGGVHATVATGEADKTGLFDHIITGEGEISFSRLLSDFEKSAVPERIIRGISGDIKELPYPDRGAFDYENGEAAHPWLPFMERSFVSIIAGRGCPFNCAFCQPAERMVFGDRTKIRPVADIIAELRFLRERYNFKSLLIHDDLFTIDRRQVIEFCRAYREEKFPASFTCQARTDFIVKNEDVVAEMALAGLKCFMIGFESGSQRVLDFLKKGTTVEQNLAAAKICDKHGIKIFANYMFGVPTETDDEVRQTVNFIRRIRPFQPSPCFFTPYPGTELGDYCIKNDLLLEKSETYYNRSANAQGKLKGINYAFLKAAAECSVDYPRDNSGADGGGAQGEVAVRLIRTVKSKLEGKSFVGVLKAAAGFLRRKLIYFRYGLGGSIK